MTPTRTRALDAAIELVGTAGIRALTHVRVDERAGLPKGSTSNYFRTRDALLSGVVDRIVEREMPAVDAGHRVTTGEDLVDLLCDWYELTTRANRTLTAARLALFLEASHHTGLRAALSRGRTEMEASVVWIATHLGARDPGAAATALMACSEGLILHSIARHDDRDPRPAFEVLVRGVLG